MVPARNKGKRLSSVNHTTKAIHHHHHHHHYHRGCSVKFLGFPQILRVSLHVWLIHSIRNIKIIINWRWLRICILIWLQFWHLSISSILCSFLAHTDFRARKKFKNSVYYLPLISKNFRKRKRRNGKPKKLFIFPETELNSSSIFWKESFSYISEGGTLQFSA